MEHPDTAQVRSRLGELAAMADATDATERKILAAAEKRLEKLRSDMPALAAAARTGGASEYEQAVEECGRLEQVIAQAKLNLR